MSVLGKTFTGRTKQVNVEKRREIIEFVEKILNISIETVYCRGPSIIDSLYTSTCPQCLYNNNCKEIDCKEYSVYEKILKFLMNLKKI